MPAKVVTLTAPTPSRIYLPEIFMGMAKTLRHFLKNLLPTFGDEIKALLKGWKNPSSYSSIPTIGYPEQRRDYSERFRGRHILKAREDGTLKCVACYMCQTACPADCIEIDAGEHPVLAYEKYPVKFEIDMLRCVFCGFCVDACPKDAIWMTGDYELAFFDRKSAVYGIPELTEKPSDTAEGGPGYGYRPYYGESPMKKAGEFEPSGLPLLPMLAKRGDAINKMAPPPPPPAPPAAKPSPAAKA
ncbi:MAG TPA: NADH-quinone oxidoreductase subunit I [Thermoanaerobaculia bacterium]|nr:NADH-quinone oxidoreductase subunit I [Thermoanaerobaculia bacterium]